MWNEVDQAVGVIEGRGKGESLDFCSKSIALERTGTPNDVAGLASGFLASPYSDYVTGQTTLVGIVFT